MATGTLRRTGYLATGTTVMTGIAKGTTTGGPALNMALVKPGTLSAEVTVEAETDTITIEAFWEVSSAAGGAGTYYPVTTLNNAAQVVWATGTAGDDAVITKVLPAPDAVYGYPYARCSVKNLVADGLVADTYAIGYNFVQEDRF